MTDRDVTSEVARVLGEHGLVWQSDGDYGELVWVECSCDGWEDDLTRDASLWHAAHRRHQADMLIAAGLVGPDHDARVAARTFEEWSAQDDAGRRIFLPPSDSREDIEMDIEHAGGAYGPLQLVRRVVTEFDTIVGPWEPVDRAALADPATGTTDGRVGA